MIGLVIAVTMCCISLWLWYRHYYQPYIVLKRLIGLPGPQPEMLFGNSRALVKKAWVEWTKQWNEQYGPTYLYFVGIQPVIYTEDPKIVHSVLINKASSFIERLGMPFVFDEKSDGKEVNSLFGANRHEWRRMHRIFSPLFTSKKVMQMGPLVEICCTRMMKRLDKELHDNDTIDVYELFGDFTLEAILTIAFGRDLDSQSNEGKHLVDCLRKLTDTGNAEDNGLGNVGMITTLSHARWTISLFRALMKKTPIAKSWNYLNDVARMIVDERSLVNSNRADLLQGMIRLMNNEANGDTRALNKAEVILNSRIFILGGFGTTRNAISTACYHLAADLKMQEKAFDEIKNYFDKNPNANLYEAIESFPYIEMIVLEALRHHPPIKTITRHCVETCSISDTLIVPVGTDISIPSKSMNFNSEYWSNPNAFDPERFDPSNNVNSAEGFLSFGAGPRSCIGKRLGLLDAKMGLVSILKMYKLSLADSTNVVFDYAGELSYPKYGVQLKITPR